MHQTRELGGFTSERVKGSNTRLRGEVRGKGWVTRLVAFLAAWRGSSVIVSGAVKRGVGIAKGGEGLKLRPKHRLARVVMLPDGRVVHIMRRSQTGDSVPVVVG